MISSQEVLQLNTQLQKHINEKTITVAHIDELRNCIQACDQLYYVASQPVVADAQYDAMYKALLQLEAQHPELITASSPTQRVGHGQSNTFENVPHLVPMLSLENSYDAQDLMAWDKRCKDLCNQAPYTYCVEPKFDGASISLIFSKNNLQRAATRGNGVHGDEITANAKQIRSVPLSLQLNTLGIDTLEVRGEVVMHKHIFAKLNEKAVQEGSSILANPRNAASGALRLKDPREVTARELDAFFYHASSIAPAQGGKVNSALNTHYGTLQALAKAGLKTSVQYAKIFATIEEVIEYAQQFEAQRDNLPYEIDGLVIKINELSIHEIVGQTSHHPRWAIAYKFAARQATSRLLDLEYQVGRTGSITPVAKIEPVQVGGVTVQSISLFNADVIKEKDLMIGDAILVERAGDVIPYIVKSFAEVRTGEERAIIFPSTCPVCNAELQKPDAEAVWRCGNFECKAQVAERLIHFASKEAMDIRGLGEANMRKFFELGFIAGVSDIYELPYQKIATLEGFGDKSIEKMKAAIEASKVQPLNRLIFALGIRYVGETTAKTLARSVATIADLYTKTTEELLLLDDVGEKVASSIVAFFAQDVNKKTIEQLAMHGVNIANQLQAQMGDASLSGKTFLFTGTLSMKRSEAEALAEAQGGSILGSVSSKLNYLVVGEDAGSKLEKAKKLGSISILSEAEFLTLIGQ